MRLEKSAATSCSLPDGLALLYCTVGSDISSATHGSSVASIAGKNRPPTMQWAKAPESGKHVVSMASANARRMDRDIEIPHDQDVNGRWQPIGCRTSRAGRR